jgi:hypothetical protein
VNISLSWEDVRIFVQRLKQLVINILRDDSIILNVHIYAHIQSKSLESVQFGVG